jgi:hypothetical protein
MNPAVMQVLPGMTAGLQRKGQRASNTQALRVEGMDATNNIWQNMGNTLSRAWMRSGVCRTNQQLRARIRAGGSAVLI